jgi:ribosome maturation factor RimP
VYREIPRELLEVIEPIVFDHALEVVDIAVGSSGGRQRIYVVVDTPAGDGAVTVEECAAVSREIGHALEAAGLVLASYLLEVSSPGVDRVLAREKDFERAVGRRVAVQTREPLEGRRNFRGELLEFKDDELLVSTHSGLCRIPLGAVGRARALEESGATGKPARRR